MTHHSRDRTLGALLGLATGDALGAPAEFKRRGSFPEIKEMLGGGKFKLPSGAWTDDTAMALCLAESLEVPAKASHRLQPHVHRLELRTVSVHAGKGYQSKFPKDHMKG